MVDFADSEAKEKVIGKDRMKSLFHYYFLSFLLETLKSFAS
jgi:hypothetical protein